MRYWVKMKKRILVLNPPTRDGDYINRDQMGGMGQKISFGKTFLTKVLRDLKSSFIHQPVLQLAYAATILNKENEVVVIDAPNEEVETIEVLRRVKKFSPEYVVMAVSSSEILFERDVIAKKIKEICGAKIVAIGDTIENEPRHFKQPIDFAILGEIEKVIEKVINGDDCEMISGVMYHKENGEIGRNEKASFMHSEELDNLPFPDWSLFPANNYQYYPLLLEAPAVSMLSSRGCPYKCHYCSYPVNEGELLRKRSPKNVVDEMENNIKKFGMKGIVFRDPLFTGDKVNAYRICKIIVERKLKVVWACETRPELLDPRLLEMMAKAGCRAINMGVESIHGNELDSVGRKKIDLKKVKEVGGWCRKLGIRTTCFFILGLPGSTQKSMSETLEFSRKIDINHSDYKIATPFPGTKLKEMALANGWIKKDEDKDLGGYIATMDIGSDFDEEKLGDICDEAFKNFYYRPSWIRNELKMGSNLKKASILLSNLLKVSLMNLKKISN